MLIRKAAAARTTQQILLTTETAALPSITFYDEDSFL
jgi:hypothetical protein